MGLGRTPVLGSLAGTAVQTVTFSTRMGALYVMNTSDNDCWITLDGSVPVASDGAGRAQIMAGAALALDDIDFYVLKAIGAAAFVLQYVAVERPGSNGVGF